MIFQFRSSPVLIPLVVMAISIAVPSFAEKPSTTPLPAAGTTIAQYCEQTQSCDVAKAPKWVKLYPWASVADATTLVPGLAEPTGMITLEAPGEPIDRIARWARTEYIPLVQVQFEQETKNAYTMFGMLRGSEHPVRVMIYAGDQQGGAEMRIMINWNAMP